MTQEDRLVRQSRSQTFRWVTVFAGTVTMVFALAGGQFILASAWTAFVSGMLVEATRLDERSVAAKRLSQILAIIFAALSVFYLYTVVVS